MNTLATELNPLRDGSWTVKVQPPTGVAVEYRYSSENQARFMAAVFALGPSKLPPAHRLVGSRKRKKISAPRQLTDVSPEEIDSVLKPLEAVVSPR